MINLKEFIVNPENRKLVVGVLAGISVFFLLVLVIRSCRKPDAESVTIHIQNLSSPIPETRLDAALGLARLVAPRAAPQVETVFLSDPDERVRRAAAYSLLVLDRNRFLGFLESDSDAVRLLTLETIARRDKEDAFSFMEQALRDHSPEVRTSAFGLLDRFGGRRAFRVFQHLAENPEEDEAMRIRAISLLALKAGPEILEPLKHMSRMDPSKDIRLAAAEALRTAEQRFRPVER